VCVFLFFDLLFCFFLNLLLVYSASVCVSVLQVDT